MSKLLLSTRTTLVVLMLSVIIGCDAANTNSTANGSSNQVQKPILQERVVKDEIGHEVKLPAEPKRIIGMYLEDELLSLGVTPIKQSRIGAWSGQD
jgi:iron complex transport system substrate-binding protein